MLKDITVGDRPLTRERLVEEIRDYLRRVDVEEAILYGSYARGEERRHSDADLMLISSRFKGVRFLDRLPPLYLEWRLVRPPIELLAYTPEEFEEARKQIGIERIADREGIRIMADDESHEAT
ncbi:MAG: nucleotidyltransferase domain-containing protein [candidate division WS1 bacterium]|jgi:predicted nucleotidyltransferase|nr:nucleotidyltransferase domain-containing protein [candidate division WS1 bacterium]